jgi:hypothetical protein
VSGFKQTYVIGGQRYATIPDGATMVRLDEQSIPISSFASACTALTTTTKQGKKKKKII